MLAALMSAQTADFPRLVAGGGEERQREHVRPWGICGFGGSGVCCLPRSLLCGDWRPSVRIRWLSGVSHGDALGIKCHEKCRHTGWSRATVCCGWVCQAGSFSTGTVFIDICSFWYERFLGLQINVSKFAWVFHGWWSTAKLPLGSWQTNRLITCYLSLHKLLLLENHETPNSMLHEPSQFGIFICGIVWFTGLG